MAVLLVAIAGGYAFADSSREAPNVPDLALLAVLSWPFYAVTSNSPAIPLLTTLSAEKIPLFANTGEFEDKLLIRLPLWGAGRRFCRGKRVFPLFSGECARENLPENTAEPDTGKVLGSGRRAWN